VKRADNVFGNAGFLQNGSELNILTIYYVMELWTCMVACSAVSIRVLLCLFSPVRMMCFGGSTLRSLIESAEAFQRGVSHCFLLVGW
jgi:hypothetical protein